MNILTYRKIATVYSTTLCFLTGSILAMDRPLNAQAGANQVATPVAAPKKPAESGPSPLAWHTVIFDIVAHQDDWQLFMNPNVYNEVILPNTKNVFIYTTAGDAGNKQGKNDHPYYKSREEGANRSVRFIADAVDSMRPGSLESNVTINGHVIKKSVYKNTVSYFLRLPDGGVDGVGLPAGTDAPSIMKLYNGQAQILPAVDGSTIYTGRLDLKGTLEAIVRSEIASSESAKFNLIESDPELNRSDHLDHRFTTKLMEDIQIGLPCIDVVYFKSYITSSMDANETGDDLFNDVATFAIMVSGQSDYGYEGTWNVRHKGWLARNYFRTVPASRPGNWCFSK